MDGPLLLTRVVRKAIVSFEAINALGDASTVQVDCLAPELTPRALVGILCNDLLVLCRDPSEVQRSILSQSIYGQSCVCKLCLSPPASSMAMVGRFLNYLKDNY